MHRHTYTVSLMYMSLWTYKLEYLKKKQRKAPQNDDINMIGRIELFPDYKILNDPSSIYQYNYDWAGHIRNWSPGMLKNYLQCLMACFNGGKERLFESEEIVNEAELANLFGDTLYVPDYTLIMYSATPADSNDTYKNDQAKLFADYTYSYTLVNTNKLSDRILTSKKPFYYMVYVKDCGSKIITIINSQTGEIIYSDYTKISYNMKSGDLKDLSNAIKRAK